MTGDAGEARNKLALVGMMGAGKTTLGLMAAQRLGWEFVDADQILEDEAGTTIAEIFRSHGEEEFRRRELEIIRRVVRPPGRRVVAAGGGAFCQRPVRDFLLNRALVLFLRVEEKELIRRLALSDPAERPMLSGDWRERVAALVRERYPLYDAAHLAIDVGEEPPAKTLERLLAAVAEYTHRKKQTC